MSGRADAQHRRHHGLSGRPGRRHAGARRLRHGGAACRRDQGRVRFARHPVVHRFRSRPDRVLRQRRHPRFRAFARDRPAEGCGRGAAALARQRGACAQAHQRCRPRAVRGQPGAWRRGARAGHADRDGHQGRLRVPEPQGAGVRSQRSRRLRPRGARRPRCLRLHRARGLPLRRDGAGDDAVARRPGHGRARRAAHARGRAAGRGRISPHASVARSGRGRARAGGDAGVIGRRPAPGACAPSPIRSARRSARRPSWSRTMCPTGSNSSSPPRPKAMSRTSPGRDHRRWALSLRRAGGQARARRRGDCIARRASGRALPAISSGLQTRTSRPPARRSKPAGHR